MSDVIRSSDRAVGGFDVQRSILPSWPASLR